MSGATCSSCGAAAIDWAGRCAACGALEGGSKYEGPAMPEYKVRIARKAWECHGAGGRAVPARWAVDCVGTIQPGDRCIEVLDEVPNYTSGPRVCVVCAGVFYGINLTDNEGINE